MKIKLPKGHCYIVPILFAFFLLIFNNISLAQNPTSEAQLKQEAAKYFEAEDYSNAYPLYAQLLSLYPDDPNYNYRVGACMLFTKEDKEKPIDYLLLAVKQPNVDHMAYYYLGRAYHLNYKFDAAIRTYQHFQQIASSSELKKHPVNRLIDMCNNGKTLLNNMRELDVLEKKQLNLSDYFQAYDLSANGGSVLVEPDDFKSKLDKKKNFSSIVYLSVDKNKVFYASYGDDDKSGTDIYMVRRLPTGGFSKPTNLGTIINSPDDEDFPFYDEPTHTLYFSSKGHNSMGGFDVFKSVYNEANDTWSSPENMDFPVNTPDDDILFIADTLNQTAYFASTRFSPKGSIDIYKIKLQPHRPEYVQLKGITYTDENKNIIGAKITVNDLKTNHVVGEYNSSQDNGSYFMALQNGGKFVFTVETPGHKTQSEPVMLPVEDGLATLRQQIGYEASTDKLIIKNDFQPAGTDSDYLLALNYIKQKAQMDVHIDSNLTQQTNLTQTQTNNNTTVAQNNNNSTFQNPNSNLTENNNTNDYPPNGTIGNKNPKNNNNSTASTNNQSTSTGNTNSNTSESGTSTASTNNQNTSTGNTNSTASESGTSNVSTNNQNTSNGNNNNSSESGTNTAANTNTGSNNTSTDQLVQSEINDAKNNAEQDQEAVKNLKDDANKATQYANAKLAQSQELQQEAQQTLDNANNVTDPSQKSDSLAKAATLKQEANDASKKAIEAFELAAQDQNQANAKQRDANQSLIYSNKLDSLGKTSHGKEEIAKLQAQNDSIRKQEQNSQVPTTSTADIIKQQAENTKLDSVEVAHRTDDLKKELPNLQQESQNYIDQAQKTDNAQEKVALLQQAKDLADSKKQKEKEIDENAKLEQQLHTQYENQLTEAHVADSISKTSTQENSSQQVANDATLKQEIANYTPTHNNTVASNTSVQSTNSNNSSTSTDNNNQNQTNSNQNNTALTSQANSTNNSTTSNQNNNSQNNTSTSSGNNTSNTQTALNNTNTTVDNTQNNTATNVGNTTSTTQSTSGNNTTTNNITAANNSTNPTNNTSSNQVETNNTIASNSQTNTDNNTGNTTENNQTNTQTASTNNTNQNTNQQSNVNQSVSITSPIYNTTPVTQYNSTSNVSTVVPTTTIQYSNPIATNADQKATQLNSDATTLNNQAIDLRKQAKETTDREQAKALYKKADSLDNAASQERLKSDEYVATANTDQYEDNKQKLGVWQNKLKNTNSDAVTTANLLMQDAEFYYNKAISEKQKADSTDKSYLKQSYLDNSKEYIATALLKQQKAENIYLSVDKNLPAYTNTVTASTVNPPNTSSTSNTNTQQNALNTNNSSGNQSTVNSSNNQSSNISNNTTSNTSNPTENTTNQTSQVNTNTSNPNSTQNSSSNSTIENTSTLTANTNTGNPNSSQNTSSNNTTENTNSSTSLNNNSNNQGNQVNTSNSNSNTNSSQSNPANNTSNTSNSTLTASTSSGNNTTQISSTTNPDNSTNSTSVQEAHKIDSMLSASNSNNTSTNSTNNNTSTTASNTSNNNSLNQQASTTSSTENPTTNSNQSNTNNNTVSTNNNTATNSTENSNTASNQSNNSTTVAASNTGTNPNNSNSTQVTNTSSQLNNSTSSNTNSPNTTVNSTNNITPNNPANTQNNNSSTANTANNTASNTSNNSATETAHKIDSTLSTNNTSITSNSNPTNTVTSNNSSANTQSTETNTSTSNSNTTTGNTSVTLSASDIFEELPSSPYSDAKPIPINPPLPEGLVFKVQIGAFRNPIPQNLFKGIQPITGEKTATGLTRYMAGVFKELGSAKDAQNKIHALGYRDAFIVAFLNGKRIPLTQAIGGNASAAVATNTETQNTNNTTQQVSNPVAAIPVNSIKGVFYSVQIGAYQHPVNASQLFNLSPLFSYNAANGYIRYNCGKFDNLPKASAEKQRIISTTPIKDAFVVAYSNGERIGLTQAAQQLGANTSSNPTQPDNSTPTNNTNNNPNNGSSTTTNPPPVNNTNPVSTTPDNTTNNTNSTPVTPPANNTSSMAYRTLSAANVDPAGDVTVSVTIRRGNISGFAKLEENVPSGFTASQGETQNATFKFEDGKAQYVWLSLPNDSLFTVSYKLTALSNASGQQTISGKFLYTVNDEKQETPIAPSTLTIGGSNSTSTNTNPVPPTTTTTATDTNKKVSFCVQIGAFSGPIPIDMANKLLKISSQGIHAHKEDNGITSYTVGDYPDYTSADLLKQELIKDSFGQSFVVAYYQGKKISLQQAQTLINK